MSIPTPEQQIEFLLKIQRLLGEGRFVASYKFALLQALADLSVEKGDDSGEPLKLTTADIAEKFIQYYWRQTLPLAVPHLEETLILKQNKGIQAAIIKMVADARDRSNGSLARAMANSRLWTPMISRVAKIVRVMPLWKLQTVGPDVDDFLYPNTKKGKEIELRPGIVYCMRQFHPLIQDLIQGGWVRFIRSISTNQNLLGETIDLREFLFGSERENLNIYRGFLRDIQSGICFYCRNRISGVGDVDHFIPWVRYPVDMGHNFVLAHPKCNRNKKDYLAAEHHLMGWVERNQKHYDDLHAFFLEKGIISDLSVSRQIACWAYQQAEKANGQVWVLGEETRPIGESYFNWRELCGKGVMDLPVAADE
jgi:5-methylcytosine-specific restriction endonuclease McrA